VKLEFVIWGGWYGGYPDYEIAQYIDRKLYIKYGGPGTKLKDCKKWLDRKYPNSKIVYKRAAGEWNADVLTTISNPKANINISKRLENKEVIF